MYQSRVVSLEAKHANADERLKEELCRPAPDGMIIASLKRQKLSLKDQINQARAS